MHLWPSTIQQSRLLLTLFAFLSVLAFAQPSQAGKVVKVNGKKVFIKLDANEVESSATGAKIYLSTKSGARKGVAVIRKMKGRNVIAQLQKGKASKGFYTSIGAPKASSKSSASTSVEEADEVAEVETTNTKKSDLKFGLMLGYNSMTQNVSQVADMAGSSIAVKGIIDYSLFDQLGVRGRFGMDMMTVTGSADTSEYETSINYLTLDLLLRYNLMESKSFGLFVNGGLGIYSPMSSELTGGALDESSISTTSILILGLGASVPMGSWSLFGGLEYFYFPPSETVKTSAIGGNIGFLF